MREDNTIPVDSKVTVISEKHVQFYGSDKAVVKSVTNLGTLPMVGIEFIPSGRFAWISRSYVQKQE